MKTTNFLPNILNSWFDKSPKKPEICDIRKINYGFITKIQ